MYPYLNLGFAHVGTFGLMLWLAAVCATIVLYKNFARNGSDADALNIVTMVVIAGIIGAKAWHELENIPELIAAWRQIIGPGLHRPTEVFFNFLHWFQAGFAWYGGLLASIAMLLYQGIIAKPNGLPGRRAAPSTPAPLFPPPRWTPPSSPLPSTNPSSPWPWPGGSGSGPPNPSPSASSPASTSS